VSGYQAATYIEKIVVGGRLHVELYISS